MTNIPQGILKQARKTGILNLQNRGLTSLPSNIWNLNKPQENCTDTFDADERWWEFVELTKLNLASNEISSISEELVNYPSLVTLDFHDNKLAFLPDAFSKLEHLKKIDLSYNFLEAMPCLNSAKSIIVLLLQHNKITELLLYDNPMSHCELLDLSHNALTQLTSQINNMISLRSLNLSSNMLSTFPMLSNLRHLSMLNLNNNKLKSLPECFCNFPSLKQLYARNNALRSLPNLQSCDQLLELYLGNNSLTIIPENLSKSITILELRDNKINDVPQSITSFTKLERFDIANNNVSKLPPVMGNMLSIKVIALDGNPLRTIRRDIINRGTQAVLKHLKSRIVLSNDDLKNVQKAAALPQSSQLVEHKKKHELLSMGKLTLTKESVAEVEKRLFEASEISLFDISVTHCSLMVLPESLLLQKNNLKVLNVSSNKLTNLPSSIGTLIFLTHADFSNNILSDLPMQFQNLVLLREVNLSNNKLKNFPDCLYEMKQLEHIFVDNNQISNISALSIQKLESLMTLSLQNNSISQVPPELGLLKKLQTLKLEGNIFRIPRQSIVQKGSLAIIEYLRSRLSV